MNQQGPDILPSVELPSPAQEPKTPEQYQVNPDTSNEQDVSRQIEKGISTPATNQTQQPQISIPSMMPPVSPRDEPPAGVPGVAATPQIADDSDLIEKEWVDKAKQIVERTRHDPHQQNKEMNLMKADYLKKRYNKDVKLSD